jgi:hypothetical protein
LVEELSYALEDVWWQLLIYFSFVLQRSADRHEPVVYLLVLRRFQVLLAHTLKYLLKSTSHVAEETHACDFNKHLKEVLISGVAFDISIAYRRESGVNPVNCSDVKALIVELLYLKIMVDVYPSIL